MLPSTSVPLKISVHTVCQPPLNTSTVARSLPPIRSKSKPKDRVAALNGAARVRVICEMPLPPLSCAMVPGVVATPAVVHTPLQPLPPTQLAELKLSTEEETET